ncbi:MAG: thioredoxin [Rhodospirillales bacterium]
MTMALILDSNRTGRPAAAPQDVIKDTDTKGFRTDVVEASMQVPVIVDFWAPWCGPCKQLGPMLEKLVVQAGGLVRLVKINIDENQSLAQQLRVQSVPTVYAFYQGQPVDGFVGVQPESKLRAFIDRLTGGAKAPAEEMLEIGQRALDSGDAETATAAFSQILAEDPGHPKAVAGLIRSRIARGDVAGARKQVNKLPAPLVANGDVAAAITAIELAEQTRGLGDVTKLESRVAAHPEDRQARFDLAMALFGKGRTEAAVDALLDLVRLDRQWNDHAARTQLLKIFDALGPTNPLTARARRRLSSILFS